MSNDRAEQRRHTWGGGVAQLERTLAPEEREAIVAFLETLTGPIPAGYSPPAAAK